MGDKRHATDADRAHGGAHEGKRPSSKSGPLLGLMTLLAAGGLVLLVAGATLTGTILTFLVAAPILLLFSPLLFPVTVAAFVSISAGLLSAAAFGVALCSGLLWLYDRFKRRRSLQRYRDQNGRQVFDLGVWSVVSSES